MRDAAVFFATSIETIQRVYQQHSGKIHERVAEQMAKRPADKRPSKGK